ncbi:MAG: YciE/YciF ferroxidase family protein [Salinarimonas sp.]
MTIKTLQDLYIDQLQDIASADRQARTMTGKLAEAATNPHLDSALRAGVEGIERGISAVESILARHGAAPKAGHCKGMEGLVQEAQLHAIDEDFADDAVKDAMIITQYQRMTHYGIAGYGCVAAFAKRLGHEEDAKVLEACLAKTRDGDRHMTEIARTDVNRKAA